MKTKDKILLCIGYQERYIHTLLHAVPDHEIIVVEEPTLIKENVTRDIKMYSGKYQQNSDAIQIAQKIGSENNITAVIPLREYAVPCAHDIAEILKLPKVGKIASRCFRDKTILRNTLQERKLHYIHQPRFKKIETVKHIVDFFSENGPCVIKPSNKQSTVGVFKIRKKDEIEHYFNESITAHEIGRITSDRILTWTYQVEELIEGSEYSTETFVSNGKIIFYNGTKKITHHGPCPYEIGHLLPVSLLEEKIDNDLCNCIKELVEILCVENGVIHAEWMVRNDGTIYLIEAAGRAPGGFITDLISNSYGINFFTL